MKPGTLTYREIYRRNSFFARWYVFVSTLGQQFFPDPEKLLHAFKKHDRVIMFHSFFSPLKTLLPENDNSKKGSNTEITFFYS